MDLLAERGFYTIKICSKFSAKDELRRMGKLILQSFNVPFYRVSFPSSEGIPVGTADARRWQHCQRIEHLRLHLVIDFNRIMLGHRHKTRHTLNCMGNRTTVDNGLRRKSSVVSFKSNNGFIAFGRYHSIVPQEYSISSRENSLSIPIFCISSSIIFCSPNSPIGEFDLKL